MSTYFIQYVDKTFSNRHPNIHFRQPSRTKILIELTSCSIVLTEDTFLRLFKHHLKQRLFNSFSGWTTAKGSHPIGRPVAEVQPHTNNSPMLYFFSPWSPRTVSKLTWLFEPARTWADDYLIFTFWVNFSFNFPFVCIQCALARHSECVCTVRRPIKACDQVRASAVCRRQARRRSAGVCPHHRGWMVCSGTVRVLSVKQSGQLSFPSITSAVMIRPLEKRGRPANEDLRDSVANKLS